MTSSSPPARTPPHLNIPSSPTTVDISIIDTTGRVQNVPSPVFCEPQYTTLEHFDCPVFSFLITHPPTGKRYLFDLGIRKDWHNLPPSTSNRLKTNGWKITVQTNVADILTSGNIPLASITGIIWSHHHFDHTGDPTTFPTSTALIVGPGFSQAFLPGYPSNPSSPIPESSYANRSLEEISFSNSSLQIGRFKALDFFNDGSFYLLSTPGHAIGHMSALVRTTAGEDPTFMLLGGDVAHHCGEFRPSPYLPLPETLNPSPLPVLHPGVCPGEVLARQHRLYPGEGSWTQPFLISSAGATSDVEEARRSVEGLEELDACEGVWTVLAHDGALVGRVRVFPDEGANGWKGRGWRKRTLWAWVGDFAGGLRREE